MASFPVTVVNVLSGGAFQGVRPGTDERKLYMLAYVDVPRFDMYDPGKCQPLGYEARELLRQHILGKEVSVVVLKEFEKNNALCVATYRGKNISARLAEAGLAKLREAKGKDSDSDEYLDVVEACERAEAAKIGLYGEEAKNTTVPVVPNAQRVKSELLQFGSSLLKCCIDGIFDPITFDVSMLPINFANKKGSGKNTVFRFRARIAGLRLVNWKPFTKGVAPNKEEGEFVNELNTMLVGKTIFLRLHGLFNMVNVGSTSMPVIYSSLFFTDKISKSAGGRGQLMSMTPELEDNSFNQILKIFDQKAINDKSRLFEAKNLDARNGIVELTRRDYSYYLLWNQMLDAEKTTETGRFAIRCVEARGDGYDDSSSMKYRSEADIALLSKLDDIMSSKATGLGGAQVIAGAPSGVAKSGLDNYEALDRFLTELPKFKALVTRVPGFFNQCGSGSAKANVAMTSGANAFYCIPLDNRFRKQNKDIPDIIKMLLMGKNAEASKLIRSHVDSVKETLGEDVSEESLSAALGEIKVQFARTHMNYEDNNSKISAYETREYLRTLLMDGKLNDNFVCPGIVTIRTDRVINGTKPTQDSNAKVDQGTTTAATSSQKQKAGERRTPTIAGYVYIEKQSKSSDKAKELFINEELVKAGYAKFIPMTRRPKADASTTAGSNGAAKKTNTKPTTAKSTIVNVDELNPDTFPNYSAYTRLAEASKEAGAQAAASKGSKKSELIQAPEFIKTQELVDLKRADMAKNIMHKSIPCTIEGIRLSIDTDDLIMNTGSVFITVATHTPFVLYGKKRDLANVTIPNILSTVRLAGVSTIEQYDNRATNGKRANAYLTQLLSCILTNLCNGCIYQTPVNALSISEPPSKMTLVKTTAKRGSFIGQVSVSSQYRTAAPTPENSGLTRSILDLGKVLVHTGLGYVDTTSPDLSTREVQLYVDQIAKIQAEAESKRIGAWSILRPEFKIDNVGKLLNSISTDKFSVNGSGAATGEGVRTETMYMDNVAVGTPEHPRVIQLTINVRDKKLLTTSSIISGFIADEAVASKRAVKVHLVGVSDESDPTIVQSCFVDSAGESDIWNVDMLAFGTARLRSSMVSAPQDCVCGVLYMKGDAPAVNSSKVFDASRGSWAEGSFNSYLVGELNNEYASASFYGPRRAALAKVAQAVLHEALARAGEL